MAREYAVLQLDAVIAIGVLNRVLVDDEELLW
jgi:hypothetical protein